MLIRGGTVVNAGGESAADVVVRNGKIAEVRAGADPEGEVIDATGLLVLPGVVDPHTHLLLDTGTARTADDFESGSASAAAGGVTTYLEFVPQLKGQRFLESVAARRQLIDGRSHVDYGIHLSISQLLNGWEEDLEALVASGVTSAKIYTTYRDTIFYTDDWTWYRLMERSGQAGLLVQVHAENDAIVEGTARQLVDEGKRSLRYHGAARPGAAEAEAVARGLLFSRVTGSPVYFVHLSTPLAVDLIREARQAGVRAVAESCPHYLVLDDSRYAGPDAARFVMTPPLRDAESQAGLWQRLQSGDIQAIGSDHCGFALAGRAGVDDFTKVSPGIPGVETSLLLLYSFGVMPGRLRLPDLVRLLSTNPAKTFGLWPPKGEIAPGFDADIVLFDPRPERTLSASELHSRAGFSPYEGLSVSGRVKTTILRGQVVYHDGKVAGPSGFGQFQQCAPFRWNTLAA
ncbi:MAG TPA: dihydropyrimidinase [Candidatus Dormibacteraeota bacterium]|nr:dihydropyrimidinase [Candidatus Dormibacteraeota bacterium]